MADGRVGRTTEEIDEIKSRAHRRIIAYMKRDMTKNEILSTLFEVDGIRRLVACAEWEVLEQLNQEFFAAYRARLLRTRPELQTFVPTPRGSECQLGVPLAPGPQVNWQPPMPNIGTLSLVEPWAPQGPHDMEDPKGIPERNSHHNWALMQGVNPRQDCDFTGIFLEPTVNSAGLVGAVPEGSLSEVRTDVPEDSDIEVVETTSEPDADPDQANIEVENNPEADAEEVINKLPVRDLLNETHRKPKAARNRKLIRSYLRKLNKASCKISKSAGKKFSISNVPWLYLVQLSED